MTNRIVKSVIIGLSVFMLTGCWDYIGIHELTIVLGIAIDKDEKEDEYKLAFEVVNLAESAKDKMVNTKIIESKGKTIFDAVRNAKKRVKNKLHFSNAQIVVISNQIAKEDGIDSIINWFLRDAEIRETMNFLISKENTAKEVITKNSIDTISTSYEIGKIIKGDNSITSSTKNIELYEMFNTLRNTSTSLTLPLFHIVKNDDKKTVEVYGIATFDGDKLIGYLNATESKYYLFVSNQIKGGILALNTSNSDDGISLEIGSNITTKDYSYKNKKFTITINTNAKVFLDEVNSPYEQLHEKDINRIEKQAEMLVTKNINKVIKKAKEEFKTDIFGFGNVVYNKNPKLWKKVKKDWNQLFVNMDIKVKSNIEIVNTSLIK